MVHFLKMLGVKPGNPSIKNTAAPAAFTLGVQSGIIAFVADVLWCFLEVFLNRTNVEM